MNAKFYRVNTWYNSPNNWGAVYLVKADSESSAINFAKTEFPKKRPDCRWRAEEISASQCAEWGGPTRVVKYPPFEVLDNNKVVGVFAVPLEAIKFARSQAKLFESPVRVRRQDNKRFPEMDDSSGQWSWEIDGKQDPEHAAEPAVQV